MRSLEVLLLLGNLPTALRFFFHRYAWPYWLDVLPLATFLVFLIHASAEGARWQMTPAYTVTVGLFGLVMVQIVRSSPVSGSFRAVVGTLGTICLAISLVLSTAFPVFKLLPPSGDFEVGIVSHEVDQIRFHVWYPADASDASPSTYLFGAEDTRPLAQRFGFPAFALGHFHLVKTASRPFASPSKMLPNYPLVMFSPDSSYKRPELYTTLLQDLASQGYVTVGLHHAPGAETSTIIADVERVLDWLEALAPEGAFGWLADRVDFARIAYVGHGTGGGAAVESCRSAGTFRVGVTLGEALPNLSGVHQPFLVVWTSHGQGATESSVEKTLENACVVRIPEAGHDSVTDLTVWSPLIPMKLTAGTIVPDRAHQILAAYLHAFVNKHLNRGGVEPLFEGPSSDFPEVLIEIHEVEE